MTTQTIEQRQGSIPVALLRITLGVIIVATWFGNVRDDLYSSDEFAGLLEWLGSPEGNDGSLGFVHSILDAVVVPAAGFFGPLQLVVELVIGLALVVGVFSRLFSLLAAGFFMTLFLAYFGGEEWIWTYVLLFMASVTVYLDFGGRRLGVDEMLHRTRGDSPAGNNLW